MSITAIVVGLIGGAIPDLIGMFKAKQDNRQELEIIKLQQEGAATEGARRFDLSVLTQDAENHRADLVHDTSAGQYTATTWLGRWLFDMVAVWRAGIRPAICTSLIGFYIFIKIKIVTAALPTIAVWSLENLHAAGIWTTSDIELLMLTVSFYFSGRALDKRRGDK